MQWTSMLSAGQWALLLAVPLGILALYFLKLKRNRRPVSSTYLWRRSINDMRVNSLWQRLRQSLLLLLQLLAVLALILALLRPSWETTGLTGARQIFLIDNSASMQAKDLPDGRLRAAKERIVGLINSMQSGDSAMLISFADTARVEQGFTYNRRELLRALEAVTPTNRTTSLKDALVAAAGLANAGSRQSGSDTDSPAKIETGLYIASDGRFPPIEEFSLGNLVPNFIPVVGSDQDNLAITAFNISRDEQQVDHLQAYARIENSSLKEQATTVELYRGNQLIDASDIRVPPGQHTGVVFALGNAEPGILRLRLTRDDQLLVDNNAWAVINPTRKVRLLVVTAGNEALSLALNTAKMKTLAQTTFAAPATLDSKSYADDVAAGKYDLVLFDDCRPKTMPATNTIFLGQLPPVEGWSAAKSQPQPQVVDIARGHPLMQGVDLSDVLIMNCTPLTAPTGSARLVDADIGTLLAVAPRAGFQDLVVGFDLYGSDGKEVTVNTNWPIKLSFPVFLFNAIEYLGGSDSAITSESLRPGKPAIIRLETSPPTITVQGPGGLRREVRRNKYNSYVFPDTETPGGYTVAAGGGNRYFAVNLFDSQESDLRPLASSELKVGATTVPAQAGRSPARRETWRWLLLGGLGVLLLEWYIYNRRVYL